MKNKLFGILFSLMLLAGMALLAYPWAMDYLNREKSGNAIQILEEALMLTDPAALQRQRELAQNYNQALQTGAAGEEEYSSILDFGDGTMGYLTIPKIHVELPVYHGTGEDVLSRGLGHIPESAFPIGGEGNHTALVGHTGLRSGKILDDLVELEVDDLFVVTVLGEKLIYQVEQILVVQPEDSRALAPVPGKDYCTLITCTPYGVNSHRLLVRGIRVEPVQQTMVVPSEQPAVPEILWWGAISIGLLLGVAAAVGLLVKRLA